MKKKTFFSKEKKRSGDRTSVSRKAGSDRPRRNEAAGKRSSRPVQKKQEEQTPEDSSTVRLNKYIADCGICARRKAGELILEGAVTVNGELVIEPGFRVTPGTDKVAFRGEAVRPVERKVYILMNKPRDTITSASDEKGRHTVMDIVGKTIKERVFPVGRLDRNTTGLLLLTNDGDLASKLSHPSHEVKKLYHVVLNKPLPKPELEQIQKGVVLEDGVAEVDQVSYVEGAPKNEVGIELHSGKNRIVRRIFEHLGFEVEKLDRVIYAGLTKKDVPRGQFRHLTEKEVIFLKHFTSQKPAPKKKKEEKD